MLCLVLGTLKLRGNHSPVGEAGMRAHVQNRVVAAIRSQPAARDWSGLRWCDQEATFRPPRGTRNIYWVDTVDQRQEWEGKNTNEEEPRGLVWQAQERRIGDKDRQGSLKLATLGHGCALP